MQKNPRNSSSDSQAPTMPPSKADAAALEFERRLQILECGRRTGASGLFRALAEAHAELAKR